MTQKITERDQAFGENGEPVCTMCGKAIAAEDEDTYLESKRCSRCHDELDTNSGPISVL